MLADPEGNDFCLIEPGNSFLAGCGNLGDQETAIQSPHGGTKVAWGGPPEPAMDGRNRQRFHVTTGVGRDLKAEKDRLTASGATELGITGDGAVDLTDPDSNDFWLTGA